MRVFTFATLLFSGISSVSATAAGAERDASKANFDIYQGPNEQDSIINDPSTQLEYTLSGGQP
jgi:catalase